MIIRKRFEDQNILNVPQCEHLLHRYLIPWLVTFLKQTEQGYLGGPGFVCTSPARDNNRSSGSYRVRLSATQLSNESWLPRTTDSTP